MSYVARLLLLTQGNEGNFDRLAMKFFSISRKILHQITPQIFCSALLSVYISDMKAYKFNQLT
jgi:hypothetical protein